MTGGDREKLAREMHGAMLSPGMEMAEYFCADIAIAYAEKRVAEALRAAEEAVDDARMGEENGLWANAILGIRALSPAREGGSDE